MSLKRPRVPASEPGTVWTIAQLQAFLATARQHRLFTFFHLAAYTGARRGELLNLRWADVGLDAKKITISGSARRDRGRTDQRDHQERTDAGHRHR
jgi:integrase